MALLDILKPAAPIAFDHTEGNADVLPALNHWKTKNWPALIELYNKLPSADRTHLIIRMGWFAPIEDIPDYQNLEPEIKVYLAGISHAWAWRARGFGYGEDVQEEDWDKCHFLSAKAYEILKNAEKDLPKDSNLFALMLYNEHLLAGARYAEAEDLSQEGQTPSTYIDDVVNYAAKQLKQCTEDNILAAHAHILFDSPKWYGDTQRLFGTTHYYLDDRPSPYWIGLHAMAYFEEWYWYVAFEEDKNKARKYKDSLDTLPFIDEVMKLDSAYWQNREGFSGQRPAAESRFAQNYFSAFLTQICQEKLAKPHLEEMGSTVSFIPWCRVYGEGDIYNQINKARRKAGLNKVEFKG